MANRKDEYEFTTVYRIKDVEKLTKQGWELVESSGKESLVRGSDFRALMRRPNPKYRGA